MLASILLFLVIHDIVTTPPHAFPLNINASHAYVIPTTTLPAESATLVLLTTNHIDLNDDMLYE